MKSWYANQNKATRIWLKNQPTHFVSEVITALISGFVSGMVMGFLFGLAF